MSRQLPRLNAPFRAGRIPARTILFLVFIVGLVVLLLDVRARSLSSDANSRLEKLAADGRPDLNEVHSAMRREPSSVSDVNGGLIEVYNYGGGMPWRTYVVRVGYAGDADQTMRYLDHNLNEPEGEFQLEQVVAAHEHRESHPPAEEVEDLEGPVEVGSMEEYRGRQRGARLIMAYDAGSRSFGGTLRNLTRDTIYHARILVQLSNGVEVGPTMVGDVEPGMTIPVEVEVDTETESTNFDRWIAYVNKEMFKNEEYSETRQGAEIKFAYDADAGTFRGTVKNTSAKAIGEVRVEIRLSDKTKLGPATLDDIAAGSERDVELAADGHTFVRWSVWVAVE